MSQIAGQVSPSQYEKQLAEIANDPRMVEDNITLPASMTAAMARLFLSIGAVGLLVTIVGGFVYGPRHAMASYLVGVGAAVAISLGAMFFVMIFYQVNAGWWATIKRQMENLMSLLPIALLMLVPLIVLDIVFTKGALWEWLNHDIVANDPVLLKKVPFLNPMRFVGFFVLYFVAWSFLTARLRALSVAQDRSGDRMLTNKAKFMSAWGLPLSALLTAFYGFDYFMSLEPHFFSTMWGVYIFAGGVVSMFAVISLTFIGLHAVGRLNGLITEEHFHDLGKFLFGFVCFWAYIGFGQYFLIWYGNIPEETFYMIERKTGGWEVLSATLAIGHFVVPFLFLLPRTIKRNPKLLALGALWVLLMHVLDYVWIVRPILHHGEGEVVVPTPATWWVDVAAIVGVLGIFFGLYVLRIGSVPLIGIKDPKLPEAMGHKNYV